jgi:hypothetical protein
MTILTIKFSVLKLQAEGAGKTADAHYSANEFNFNQSVFASSKKIQELIRLHTLVATVSSDEIKDQFTWHLN